MRADCHLAQYTDYEDPSDTSLLEEESSPFSPDLDYTNHQTNSFDDIDYSTSHDHDISDTLDYTDDFLDHNYGHDLSSAYLSYPTDYPLPCSPSSQTLDNPTCFPPTSSDNLQINTEMSTNTLHTTACAAIGKVHNPDTDILEVQTYMLLPDYAGIVLPPLTNTVYTLNDSRFKYPSKSTPAPKMYVDERSDQQILTDIVRTCSLNLTKEELEVYEKVAGKSVIFPQSIRQETYRTPKSLLDSAVKDLKLNKSQKQTLQQDIQNLPEYVDCHDPPPLPSDPPEQELVDITVPDGLSQLSEHVDTLLLTKSTLCLPHCNKDHKLKTSANIDLLLDIKHKMVNSQQTIYEHFLSNDKAINLLIDICRSLQPSDKTLSKIVTKTLQRPVTKKNIQSVIKFLIHQKIIPTCWQTERKIISFLLSHLFQSIKLKIAVNDTIIVAVLDSGSTYSILSFKTWQNLGIKLSDLNSNTIYNITSATSICNNAIAGTIDLFVTLQFLDGKTEIVKHTFLCASQRMQLNISLLGIDFLRHHGISINSSNSFLQVTKQDNVLYQDTFLFLRI